MDQRSTGSRPQLAAEPTRARAPRGLDLEVGAPRPKLSFGSWPIIDERPRSYAGEQCEANR